MLGYNSISKCRMSGSDGTEPTFHPSSDNLDFSVLMTDVGLERILQDIINLQVLNIKQI